MRPDGEMHGCWRRCCSRSRSAVRPPPTRRSSTARRPPPRRWSPRSRRRTATALIAVFGPENEDVVLTGDEADDRAAWGEFLRDYRALHRIDREGDDLATLFVGRDLWPFPAPLVRDAAGWHFDAEAAREEVLLRRIGQNELDVIDLLRGYVRRPGGLPRRWTPTATACRPSRRAADQRAGHARRPLLAGRSRRAGEPGRRLHGPRRGRRLQHRRRRTPSPSPTSATTSGS